MKWIKRGMIAVIIIGVVIGGAWFYIDRKVSSFLGQSGKLYRIVLIC